MTKIHSTRHALSMTWLCLVLLGLQACATSSGTANPVGPSNNWVHIGSHSYAQTDPVLGVSHRYKSKHGHADVYVYSLGHSWQPGLSDPNFPSTLIATIKEFGVAAQRVGYRDITVSSPEIVTIRGHQFAQVHYTYTDQKTPHHSLLYLTAQSGQLVKYRATFIAQNVKVETAAVERLIAQSFGRLPAHHDAPGQTI